MISRALGSIARWPVGVAAAGVAGVSGPVASAGAVDRRLPWASVTKLLTAVATLIALEEGTVALDQPAGPPGATVAHLLAHASGLPPDGTGPTVAPGTRRIYSNRGFELVAELIAERSGIAFAEYLHAAVLEPLGMTGTTLVGSPASGATGPLCDLLALAGELLTPTLIAPETLAEATSVAFPGLAGVLPGFGRQDPNDWGLGFELRDHKHPHWTGATNSAGTFGHFGRSGSFLWIDPDIGIGCVALSDREFGLWAVEAWPELSDAVVASVAGRPAPGR